MAAWTIIHASAVESGIRTFKEGNSTYLCMELNTLINELKNKIRNTVHIAIYIQNSIYDYQFSGLPGSIYKAMTF